MLSFLNHRFLNPLKEFIHDSRAIGILLLSCTALSLLLTNIDLTAESYKSFWQLHFSNTESHHWHIGFLSLPNSVILVINDLLMAIFFFLAGMEIKRELVNGELSSLKNSILPLFAAIGGMLMPAVLFTLLNKGTATISGWAIPTATDIAFSLGVASLLGNRVPTALKVFLTALAIIDDLGAIIVIALFYGGEVETIFLLGSLVCLLALFILNKLKQPFGILYVIIGCILWYCTFNSGIHATIAGVLFAFFVPTKNLNSLELKLHNWVYFLIIPLFALANTAIQIPHNSLEILSSKLSIGIIAGLVIGKPLGICLFCYFLITRKWAILPANTNWTQLIGAGILAGIGFTMSIFISTLAFADSDKQDTAKISVLLASAIAIMAGYICLRFFTKKSTETLTN